MSKSVILNEGLLKHTINTYSSGGYTLLIRNNKSGDMESIPFSSVSPDLAGYPTLEGTQTFTGLNTFTQSTTFNNGIGIVGGSYTIALSAPTLTAARSIVYPDASGTVALTTDLTAYVPKTRNITINGTTYDLSADRTWTIVSMIYPSAGIAVSTGTAWGTSITDNSTNWNTAYSSRISSLTTTGNSGAATLVSNVLNIPNYTLSGLGGQAQLNGTGFVKASGTTISYDNSTYLTGITSSQVTTALGYTPYNSTNPSGYLSGTIAVANGGTGATTRKAASSSIANFGQLENHGTYTDMNGIQQWGGTYCQGSTNAHGFNGTTQYYQMMWSLGANYDWGTGSTYAMQMAIARNVTTPYIGIRYKEGGADTANWGSWQKIGAGYADSAGTLTAGATTAGALNVPNGYSFVSQGYNNNGGFAMNNASTYWGLMWNYAANDWRLGYGSQIAQNGWNLRWDNGSTVWANGNFIAGGDVTAYSDARVKENIETIKNALKKVLSLRGVSYTRIDSEDNKTKIGVIAQETLSILPEVVNQDADGIYSVAYGNMGGLFIEAIKEQQKQIDNLNRQIEFLVENR